MLDDVWNQDVERLLPGPPVSVLVTSRQRNWPWVESSSRELVEAFSPEEAEACFGTHLGAPAVARHRAALMGFAERMERLPIAIAVAASMLRDSADPIEEAAAGLGLAGLHTVADLLQKAIDAQPEPERRLLRAVSVCAPEGFWLPLAGRIASLENTDLRAARDKLVNASLLRVLDRDRRRFQMHALLREQVRQGAAMGDFEDRHAVALEEIFKDWETRWNDCRECMDEVIPAMEHLWENGAAARADWLADWGSSLGWRIGELEMALRILAREERFWTSRIDREAKDSLQRIYGNQALILQAWGRLEEAMALLKNQEALCLELGNRDGLQGSYGSQALILKACGRLEEAMALLKNQEALCLELGNRDGLQGSYGNQALILMTSGRREEAMALFKEKEALCLELGDKNGLQASYGNQALVLGVQGRLEEAMALLKKKEALCLELGLRSSLGYCYWNWGWLARAQGDHVTEKSKLQAALAIFTALKMQRERDAVAAELTPRS